MTAFCLSRLLQSSIILFFLVTVSFFIIHAAPGGPFGGERQLDPVTEQALKAKYHYDLPLHHQYVNYLERLLKLDLGLSTHHQSETVNEIIRRTLPVSLLLGMIAMTMALLAGLSIGVYAAQRRNTLLDHASMLGALAGLSLPVFVLGPLLQLLFSIKLRWLPIAGYAGMTGFSHLILPAATLALPFTARIARLMRAGMLDVLHMDYVRTAHSKGLGLRLVLWKHAFRGGVLPVVAYMGPAMASILTGSLVIESVFQIPGLGREFVQSALNRDVYLVLGTVVIYGTFIIFFNLLADLLSGWLDPRIRHS